MLRKQFLIIITRIMCVFDMCVIDVCGKNENSNFSTLDEIRGGMYFIKQWLLLYNILPKKLY